MGLELDTPKIDTEPIELPELAAEVLKLGAIAVRLEETLGHDPENGRPTGLCAVVSELRDTVGRAPNPATGDPGWGLCGVVGDLAQQHATQSRRMVTGATLAAGGVVGVVELVLEIVKALHG